MSTEVLESLVDTHYPAAVRGDREAYGRIVAGCQTTVTSIALAIVRDVHASEDIAQEAFLSAWQNLRKLNNPASFLPWLRQITRNLARDHLRAQVRRARPGRRHRGRAGRGGRPAPGPVRTAGARAGRRRGRGRDRPPAGGIARSAAAVLPRRPEFAPGGQPAGPAGRRGAQAPLARPPAGARRTAAAAGRVRQGHRARRRLHRAGGSSLLWPAPPVAAAAAVRHGGPGRRQRRGQARRGRPGWRGGRHRRRPAGRVAGRAQAAGASRSTRARSATCCATPVVSQRAEVAFSVGITLLARVPGWIPHLAPSRGASWWACVVACGWWLPRILSRRRAGQR